MQIYPDVRNNDVEISDIEHETLDAISTLSFKFVYFLAQYSNISHLKCNKNPGNISLYLRKFAVFA